VASLPSARGWLIRSKQNSMLRAADYLLPLGGLAIISSFVLFAIIDQGRLPRGVDHLAVWCQLLGLAAVLIGLLLRSFVRCRVCGLRVASCAQARGLRACKWAWVASLEECPVCGDDGTASRSSRDRWLASGGVGEPPYWSWRRVTLAVLVVVAIIGSAIAVGGTVGRFLLARR